MINWAGTVTGIESRSVVAQGGYLLMCLTASTQPPSKRRRINHAGNTGAEVL